MRATVTEKTPFGQMENRVTAFLTATVTFTSFSGRGRTYYKQKLSFFTQARNYLNASRFPHKST